MDVRKNLRKNKIFGQSLGARKYKEENFSDLMRVETSFQLLILEAL